MITGGAARRFVVVAVAALTATVISTGAPGSASGAPSVRGFDGSTIKIAGLGWKSHFGGSDIGAKARFKRANDTHEIKGVKFKYTGFADENGDPATATSEARRLVSQERIFAIVPDFSPVNPGPYLNQQHVPYLGFAFDNSYCSLKPTTKLYGFGVIGGCAVPANPPEMPDGYTIVHKYVAEKTGKQHPSVAIFSQDNQSGKSAARFGASAAQGSGFKVVYAKGNVPATTSDYTPYVQEYLIADGGKQPDLIVCSLSTQCLPIWDALKAAGFSGIFDTPLGIDLFAKPLAGTIAPGLFNTQPNPGLTRMKADFAAAGAPADTPIFSETAYFGADMLIKALQKVVKQHGVKGITPEAVQKVLSTQTWQIKGLVGPVKYPASTVVQTPECIELLASDGAAPWDVIEPYTCSYNRFKIDPKFKG